MPGTSHHYETRFLDLFPKATSDIGWYILEKYTMRELMALQTDQIRRPDIAEHLSQSQWQTLLRYTMLTKLTYFDLESNLLQKRQINYITKILIQNFDEGQYRLAEIKRVSKVKYGYFNTWLDQLTKQIARHSS